MTHQVRITNKAEKSLLEIAKYIAKDNPIRAYTFVDEIIDFTIKTLSNFPDAGRLYQISIKNEQLRYIPYKNYIVVYRVKKTKVVSVLLVFHAALDKNEVFKQFLDR